MLRPVCAGAVVTQSVIHFNCPDDVMTATRCRMLVTRPPSVNKVLPNFEMHQQITADCIITLRIFANQQFQTLN